MAVKIYKVPVKFRANMKWHEVSKFVRAVSVQDAVELIYSEIGSKHRVKRGLIKIDQEGIKEVGINEVTDPYIVALSQITKIES